MITHITKEDLEHAPTFSDIAAEVGSFFGPQTVLIGHNINFDLTILKRFLPVEPYAVIDTFPLTQSLIHFLPSYALEVINKSLISKNPSHHKEDASSYHHALYDAAASFHVFSACIHHLGELIEAYPELT